MLVMTIFQPLGPTLPMKFLQMINALLEATDNWALNIDRGNVNAVFFFFWLKKAFDTVDHKILLSKMNLREYKELLSIGLDHIWQIVLNNVSLMVPCLESVRLNAGYLREQFLVPFYFLFTSTICQTA